MKTFINFIVISFVLYCIGWFVKFEINPRSVCKDHPNNPSEIWLCEPGGFELKKGILESKHKNLFGKQVSDYNK